MRQRTRRVLLTLASLMSAGLACPSVACAHEKWFFDFSAYPTRWVETIRFPGDVSVSLVIAVTIVAAIWWRARNGRDLIPGPEVLGASDAGKARFYALVPLILGIPRRSATHCFGHRG